uniref:GDSL esterase/lipase At2g23540-like n=1 Tax=Erigeron canadensis TaxID=72917 RepID=UPI001CB939A0|nr:GDSL esterase/lipase At2g23540-like [Erigeron canadensis]
MDVGTNNYVENCTARVNHKYYGIDYPGSEATGRFSNGFNTADTIVQQLGGYDRSPLPYLALVNSSTNFSGDVLRGVNFASGGAGLATQIGQSFYGKVISMEEQVQQFGTVRGNITALLGESKGDLLLQNSMYIISIGSNDVMTYIFMRQMTPEQFIINITETYAIHLKNLYSLGARKFGILSIPPIGCCPLARSFNGGNCTDDTNNLAAALYKPFESLLQNLSSTLEGFKYSLGNTYNMTMNVITKQIGFKDVKSACCGTVTQQGLGDCKEGAHLCTNRDDLLFWDAFHPTQKGSQLAASALVFSQDPEVVTPINFGSLRNA